MDGTDGGGAVVCDAAPASVSPSVAAVEVSGPVVPVSVTVTPDAIGAGGKV